jgi:transcriptional regulator with XRE-family HTH domain
MSKKEIETKEEIGSRFRQFRESIGKAQHELAAELKISQSTIANIERGKAFPNINYLHYFYNNYQLNINWLLIGRGEMFSKGRIMNERYLELINLMQVPVIEQVILAKLIEIKALLKDEITAFYDKKSKEKGVFS